jgi:hypothetical protein
MPEENKQKEITLVSGVFDDGVMVELIYSSEDKKTLFAVRANGEIKYQDGIAIGANQNFVPVPSSNNLIKHKVVVLPGYALPYGDTETLACEIEEYLKRYVTLSPVFNKIAARYIMLSWVYDRFNELPYLRFRGDFGSGKTRALYVVGSLLYKPMFASGASTVSPIFHTLDLFQGSLVFDEADFRFSDAKAEITKILNNGNAKGFPVLRSVQTDKKVFDPRAFHVYGPKVVSMREHFDDLALESRFLSETMGEKPAAHIPINLPLEHEEEASVLRGKLLMYRFTEYENIGIDKTAFNINLSSRANQVLIPLLSIIPDVETREEICRHVANNEKHRISIRQQQTGALILEAILKVKGDRDLVPLSEIRTELLLNYCHEFERTPTSRYLGNVIRAKLNLPLYKSHGIFKVELRDENILKRLMERFGVERVDVGSKKEEST